MATSRIDLNRLLLALCAFAGGVLVGLLAAPQAGPQTRQRLAHQAREGGRWLEDHARQAAEPVADRVRETAQATRQRFLPLADSPSWDVVDGRDLLNDLTRR